MYNVPCQYFVCLGWKLNKKSYVKKKKEVFLVMNVLDQKMFFFFFHFFPSMNDKTKFTIFCKNMDLIYIHTISIYITYTLIVLSANIKLIKAKQRRKEKKAFHSFSSFFLFILFSLRQKQMNGNWYEKVFDFFLSLSFSFFFTGENDR